MPTAVVVRAAAQNMTNALPAARAARAGSPAPRLRETTEAAPTPTVVETAPRASSNGATRFTAAMAVGPTPRATNQAFVRA